MKLNRILLEGSKHLERELKWHLDSDGDVRLTSNMTTLEDCPDVINADLVLNNNKLTSLKGISRSVGGVLYAYNNRITHLQGIHLELKEVNARIRTKYQIDVSENPIKSHVLGLTLIKGLRLLGSKHGVPLPPWAEIVNRHLPATGKKSMYDCQEELIANHLEEYAEL